MRVFAPSRKGNQTMRRVLLLVFLLGLSACFKMLMTQPVERAAKGWTVTLVNYRDGPDSYQPTPTPFTSDVRTLAEDEERFLWVFLNVRNDQASPRVFTYDRCDLDLGTQAILPVIVAYDGFISDYTDKAEEYKAGERKVRKLVYSYPRTQFPKRLRCTDFEFALPPVLPR